MLSKNKNETINNEEDIIVIDSEEEIIMENDDVVLLDKAENESNIIIINEHEYTCSDLLDIVENRYNSLNKIDRKEIERSIDNYVASFIYCLFKTVKTKESIRRLKKRLENEKDLYSDINVCCSNKKISFNKEVIDTIIKIHEKILN